MFEKVRIMTDKRKKVKYWFLLSSENGYFEISTLRISALIQIGHHDYVLRLFSHFQIILIRQKSIKIS